MFAVEIKDAANRPLHIQIERKQDERGSGQTLVRQEAYFYQLVQFQSV